MAVQIHQDIPHWKNARISVHTVRRRLREFGLYGRIAREKTIISQVNCLKCIEWAIAHLKWGPKDWEKVLFNDESKVNMINSDRMKFIRCYKNEKFEPLFLRVANRRRISDGVWCV